MKETWGTPLISSLRKNKYLLLMLAPCLLHYLLFKYAPMFGLVIAFKDYNLFKGVWASPWVGLKWFDLFIMQNRDFWILLRNTLLLGLYRLVFGFPAPILLALLMNEIRLVFFRRLVQSVSYMPHFLSTVIVVSMTVVLISSQGLVTEAFRLFGLDISGILYQPQYFRTIYVVTDIWQHTGWETILYMAALSTIDPRQYEAARIDGAGRFSRMMHITLPGIMPTIIILLILNIGHIIDIGFEKVFLLYNPATYSTADVINTYVYRTGLILGNYSYASAIGFFNSVVGLILLAGANYISRRYSETSLY